MNTEIGALCAQRMKFVKATWLGLCFAFFTLPPSVFGQVRTYDANFVSAAPTIDGVIDGAEWDAAAGGGGDWTLLRSPAGTPDVENNRFEIVWDTSGLYVLGQSDYDFWAFENNGQNPAAADNAADYFNIFLDPNTLGEANLGQPDNEIDHYQISFNLYADERSCGEDRIGGTADDCTFETDPPLATDGVNVTGSTFGTLTAAHSGGLFDNNSEWEHLRQTHISYNVSDADGAVVEMFIPWEEFDANAIDLNGRETGLNHTTAPDTDDVWLLNVTRISSDPNNLLPVWNWTSSLFFSSHGDGVETEGHGELTFRGGPAGGPVCDLDGDGDCDLADMDAVYAGDGDRDQWLADASATDNSSNPGAALTFVVGDANLDGGVDSTDLGLLLNNFGGEGGNAAVWGGGDLDDSGNVDSTDLGLLLNNFGAASSAAAVPEPNTILLVGLGMLGFLAQRRRR